MIILEIMRQAPERVLKLALLSTSAQLASPEQAAVYEGLLAQARQGDAATVLGEALLSVLHPVHQADPALQAVNRRMGAAIGVAGLARQVDAVLSRVDSRSSLATIAVPTLVLVGEQDHLTPPDLARELAAGIAHAHLVLVPECGHGATIEQLQAVNKALQAWLTSS